MSGVNKQVAVELGDRVKDPITGLTGIVVAVTHWLNGCIRVVVQPESLHEGKPAQDVGYDEGGIVVVAKRVHEPKVVTIVTEPPAAPRPRATGGPVREGASFKRS
jgi:hypothetical protein